MAFDNALCNVTFRDIASYTNAAFMVSWIKIEFFRINDFFPIWIIELWISVYNFYNTVRLLHAVHGAEDVDVLCKMMRQWYIFRYWSRYSQLSRWRCMVHHCHENDKLSLRVDIVVRHRLPYFPVDWSSSVHCFQSQSFKLTNFYCIWKSFFTNVLCYLTQSIVKKSLSFIKKT